MPGDDFGTLPQSGDQWTLTFRRRLAHPQERVWRAITEPEHLAAWFPQEIEGERTTGATLRFVMPQGSFEGEMVEFDPPSVMEMMWGTDRLRIELTPDDEGTVLTLIDTFAELGKAARDAAGWHECVDRLVAHCDERARWKQRFAMYGERFGADASTTGPPPAWEEAESRA